MQERSAYPAGPGRTHRYYILGMLSLSYFFSVVDRNILSILSQDVKVELDLSDSQLGLLMGFAFVMFYSTFGIPVARLADRTSRKGIIAVSIGIWSAATAMCGIVTGFWSLFAARLAVGMGEAGASPPAHSMITDLFPRSQLTRALSIYLLGATLGAVGGHMIGGVLGQHFGWRATFGIVAAPGVLLALLFALTIREPRRGSFDTNYDTRRVVDPIGVTIRALLRNRAYVGAVAAHGCSASVVYALIFWFAPLLIRNFGLSKHDVGLTLGSATLIGGLPGLLFGGHLTDYLARRDHRWMAGIPALALLVSFPAFMGALFAETATRAIYLYGFGFFLFNFSFAPPIAIIQSHVEPHERALASAIVGMIVAVGGLGVLLPLVGILSDQFSGEYGARSLNVALACVATLMLVGAGLFFWTIGGLRRIVPDGDRHV